MYGDWLPRDHREVWCRPPATFAQYEIEKKLTFVRSAGGDIRAGEAETGESEAETADPTVQSDTTPKSSERERARERETDMKDIFERLWMRFRAMSYGGICTTADQAMMKAHATIGLTLMLNFKF